jgi:hypothetical protein
MKEAHHLNMCCEHPKAHFQMLTGIPGASQNNDLPSQWQKSTASTEGLDPGLALNLLLTFKDGMGGYDVFLKSS